MTIKEAKEKLAEIKDLSRYDDDESAHSAEDNLHEAVLEHIAAGGADAVELAKIALETKKLNFARWCA